MNLSEYDELICRDTFTLFEFYATWCGPCKAMTPVLDRFVEIMRDTVDMQRVDVDLPENVDLTRELRIMSVPTFVLFRSGRILWRDSGMISVDNLVYMVKRFDRVDVF